MRRKSIAYLMAIVMLVTTFAFQFSAFAATDSGITVQFQNSNNSTSSNTIIGTYNVKNTSSSPVNLADLKLKYYYTKDADKALNFWCDHSGYMSGNSYIDVTSKVKGSFVKMSQTTQTADTCLEITFSSDAGSLPAGGSITVQTRVARTDWSNFDQSNDYSFKASGSLVDWDHVVAYVGGTLKYGVEPNGGGQPLSPSISPTNATFDKAAPADIAVTLTPNGNTFNGITGLTKGTDYTVSGNTVTISKSKLATYADSSTQKFTFDFGVASNNPVLSVAIKGVVVPPTDSLKVTLGTATGKAGDTVVVPVTLADVAKAGKVGTFGFNVNYDKTLLEAVKVEAGDTVVNAAVNFSSQINAGSISFLFLDNTIGSELIDKDGVVANITFKVLGTAETTTALTFKDGAVFGDANMAKITKVALTAGSVKITTVPVVTEALTAALGTATGKAGDTVVVPVTLANVAKAGKVGTFGFNVNYDKTLLEAVKVEAGDTVANAAVNFSSQINAGSISFLFLDNTIGSELIDKDGVVANITFKVLGTAETTTALTFKDGAVFGDANMAKIAKVTLTAGSVKISVGTVVKDPVINPATASFDKAAPADVAVTITANGNTFKGITGLTKDTDYTVSGNTVTILKSKLATYAKDSTQSFTFDFGVTSNPVLTVAIKDTTVVVPTEALSAVIGTGTGKAGDTVVVPVTLANVAKAGKVGTFGFNVNYDKTLLEAVKVEAGDVVVNSAVNFSSQINAGSISFLFLDNTIGSELIDKDGVVAKITFKVLGTADATTPVTFKDGSVFGDAAMAKIAKVTLTNGSVTIKAGEVVVKDPAINPTTAKFEEGSASDLAVALTPNGNTFAGITGLTKDTDYTVSGDTVTLAKSYLNTLKAGDKVLTFNFGTKTVTLTITVTAKVVVEIKGLGVTVGTAAGKAGETVTIPVTLKNVEKAGKVGTFGFTLNYDSTLLEATKVEAGSIVLSPAVNFSSQIKAGSVTFLFLDNTIGDQLISSDGIVANVTFKVLGSSSVSAPVTFKDGAVFGDANMSKISDVTLAAGSVKLN